jgi:hypothetical protein
VTENRNLHIEALRDADKAWKESGVVDVSKMKLFLDDWFKKQLASVPLPPRPIVVRPSDSPAMDQPGKVIIAPSPPAPAPPPPRRVIVRPQDE